MMKQIFHLKWRFVYLKFFIEHHNHGLPCSVVIFIMNNVIKTFKEKKAYFDRIKLANFRESSRLEGLFSSTLTIIPKDKEEIELARQAILNRYLGKFPPKNKSEAKQYMLLSK